ncbi:unnamed protein product [Rhodiola kirilowii]
MSSSSSCNKITMLALIFLLLLSPTYLASISISDAKSDVSRVSSDGKKMKLGSRPPRCADRCLNCRPCTAALVVSPNTDEAIIQRDESYHLLSWKCRCGSKFYQP